MIKKFKLFEDNDFILDIKNCDIKLNSVEDAITTTNILQSLGFTTYSKTPDEVMKSYKKSRYKFYVFARVTSTAQYIFQMSPEYLSNNIISAEEFKNLYAHLNSNKYSKIKRPEIDPYGEDDWGYTQNENIKIHENLQSNIKYRLGVESDLRNIKKITNKLRNELGFVMNVSLMDAIKHDELYVAEIYEDIVGFIHFHKRKDGWNTVHEIGVNPEYQGKGIGKHLFNMVPKPRRLKTTTDNNQSNDFYKHQGLINTGTEKGRKRELNIWSDIF